MKGKLVRDSGFYHIKKICKMMTDWCMKVIKTWVFMQSFSQGLFLQAIYNSAMEIKPGRLACIKHFSLSHSSSFTLLS